jgi:hypothetical protein
MNKTFNELYETFADEGMCDSVGSAEYYRVRTTVKKYGLLDENEDVLAGIIYAEAAWEETKNW